MNPRRSFLASLALIPAAAIAAVKPKSVSKFTLLETLPPEAGDVTHMLIYNGNLIVAAKNTIWTYPIADNKK